MTNICIFAEYTANIAYNFIRWGKDKDEKTICYIFNNIVIFDIVVICI